MAPDPTSSTAPPANAIAAAARPSESGLSGDRFERLVAGLPIGVYAFRIHPDGRSTFDYMNDQAARMIGVDAAAAVADPAAAFSAIHPDDVERLLAESARMLEAPARFHWEGRAIVDGTTRWIRLEGEPQADAGPGMVWHGIAEDVTERHEAEEAVRRLVTAVEQSGDSIVITDLDARIVYANPAFERITGYALDEAVGANPRILQSGHQDRAFYEQMWQTLLAGETWRGELHNRRKDGSIYIEQATITPVRGPGGRLVDYVAVKRDITERRAAEEELARLAAAVDHAAEAVVVTDPDATIVYVNPEFVRGSGYAREEVIGQNPRMLQSGYHDSAFYEQMWVTLLRGEVWRGELHNRRKDGSGHIEATAITPVHDAAGRLQSYVAVKHDVTEARRAGAALRSSEERYRSLIEELDAVVWVRDMLTGEDFCSPYAATLLGYPPERLAEAGFWRTIVVDEDQERVFRIWDADEELDVYSLEYRLRRSDGAIIHVAETWRCSRDESGRATRWFGITSDITQQRRLEQTVARTDRLDSMARVTAAAAHDFGNVLQGIRLYAGFLAEAIPPDSPAAADVKAIGEAIERGAALTRQMLAVGREAPRAEPVLLDPAGVLADMEPMLGAISNPSTLRVEVPHVGTVRIVRSVIEQAVLNLVINARDAMSGNAGLINVTLGREPVAEGSGLGIPGGTYVALRVADNGPGMPPGVLARAMEPFFTTKAHGTGIGLASVYGSVRDAGGTVTIDSAPGAGTTVTVLLPAVRER